MMLIMFSYFMFLLMVILSLLMMKFLLMKNIIVFEWVIYSYNSSKFSFLIYLDYVSILFMLVVSLISFVVLIYSIEYMEGDIYLDRFSILLFMFILSMYLMILSPSILTILLGWDLLGLISYCLIIYYQNKNAFNAGLLTIFSNRIGDVGILLLICMSFQFGSWNLMNYWFDKLMLFLLILISFTKSAQIPFSLWLPAAMMAPTPVSSLVHSSTLVTAGVYLLIRYNEFLFLNKMNEYVFFFSSLTMFMAGLIANYEYDFKKIIALSTLSQLGLMMSILSLGYWELSFFHLIIHALFKSLMFLCVGSFIHYFHNNQDIRRYGGIMYIYPFKSMVLIMSLICLMGFPFLSGFYSKDLIMEMFFFNKLNKISLVLMIFSTIFTVSYSIRLILYIIFSHKNYNVLLYKKESLLMNWCMVILIFMIIFIGLYFYKLLFWNNFIILTTNMKLLVLKLLMAGCIMGVYYYYNSFMKESHIGFYFNNMFLLSKIYQFYDGPLNMVKLYEIYYEKSIFEYKIYFMKIMFFIYKFKMKMFNLELVLFTNLLILILYLIYI